MIRARFFGAESPEDLASLTRRVRDHCFARLPTYKVPVKIRYADPRGPPFVPPPPPLEDGVRRSRHLLGRAEAEHLARWPEREIPEESAESRLGGPQVVVVRERDPAWHIDARVVGVHFPRMEI